MDVYMQMQCHILYSNKCFISFLYMQGLQNQIQYYLIKIMLQCRRHTTWIGMHPQLLLLVMVYLLLIPTSFHCLRILQEHTAWLANLAIWCTPRYRCGRRKLKHNIFCWMRSGSFLFLVCLSGLCGDLLSSEDSHLISRPVYSLILFLSLAIQI